MNLQRKNTKVFNNCLELDSIPGVLATKLPDQWNI